MDENNRNDLYSTERPSNTNAARLQTNTNAPVGAQTEVSSTSAPIGAQQNAVQSQYVPPVSQNQQYSPVGAQPGFGNVNASQQVQYVPTMPQYQQYTPVGNGASIAGYANAYPMYTYQKTPQEQEREDIRSAANAGGKLTIAIFVTMIAVAIVIMIVGFFTGIVEDTPSTDDPYMGFTTMGFYLYEGLTSLASIFLPAIIIMSSFRKKNQMKTEDFLPFKPVGGKKLAAIVFGGMAVCMVAQVMAVLLSINFSLVGFNIDEAIDTTLGTNPLDIVMNSICTALIPALVEEFAYRGVVLGALKKYDTNLAIIGSAYLFGMLHGNLAQIPFAFTLGLMLAYVRIKTDSMLPNILIHFGNNFYAVIVSTIGETTPESVSTLIDAAVMVTMVAVGFICIYYLAKSDKSFFKIKSENSYLTFGEKAKVFFTSGTVIASTVILCIESLTVLEML